MSSLVGQSTPWTQSQPGIKVRVPLMTSSLNQSLRSIADVMQQHPPTKPVQPVLGAAAVNMSGYQSAYQSPKESMVAMPGSPGATPPTTAPASFSPTPPPNAGPSIPSTLYGSSGDPGDTLADFIPAPTLTPDITTNIPPLASTCIGGNSAPSGAKMAHDGKLDTGTGTPGTDGTCGGVGGVGGVGGGESFTARNYHTVYDRTPSWELEGLRTRDNIRALQQHPNGSPREAFEGFGARSGATRYPPPSELDAHSAHYTALYRKIDQLTRVVDELRVEPTEHAAEELILYAFLGVFVICVVDSFTHVGRYIR